MIVEVVILFGDRCQATTEAASFRAMCTVA